MLIKKSKLIDKEGEPFNSGYAPRRVSYWQTWACPQQKIRLVCLLLCPIKYDIRFTETSTSNSVLDLGNHPNKSTWLYFSNEQAWTIESCIQIHSTRLVTQVAIVTLQQNSKTRCPASHLFKPLSKQGSVTLVRKKKGEFLTAEYTIWNSLIKG